MREIIIGTAIVLLPLVGLGIFPTSTWPMTKENLELCHTLCLIENWSSLNATHDEWIAL